MLKGTVVWLKALETNTPNDQRWKIEGIGNGHLLVTSMGQPDVTISVHVSAVKGIELDEKHTLYFRDARVCVQAER